MELSVVQRAGHLLEAAGAPRRLTDRLATRLADQRPRVTVLRPERAPKAGIDRSKPSVDERWRLLVNDVVEVDE